MLAKTFLEQKDLYSFLSSFSSEIEVVSYSLKRVILENDKYIIRISLEDYETYASVVLERKTDKKIYYTLADYSYLDNATEMFDLIKSIDKEEYYQSVRDCIRQKTNRKNSKEKQLVSLIYKLLEVFILEVI